MTAGTADIKDSLCRRAVDLQHGIDQTLDQLDGPAVLLRACLRGEIEGLRYALCLALGIDPVADPWAPTKEGPADDYVRAWHNEHCQHSDCEGPW